MDPPPLPVPGADHPEGTWPYTRQRMRAMFADVPDDEARLMLGDNAVRVYGFDREKLMAVAQQIGPRSDTLDDATPVDGAHYARLWREGA